MTRAAAALALVVLGSAGPALAQNADKPPAPAGPSGQGISSGGAAPSASMPNEDWLTKPVPKPKVGVYYGCHLYVPEDAEQAAKANRAEAAGKFRNPKDAKPQETEKPEERHYLWCRDADGERAVDVLANHDDTAARTLGHTLNAHRLLEQTLTLDLEIGQKRAALTDDLKDQVKTIREDVRKEVEAAAAQRTWTIAGWSIAGAFFLTTVTLVTFIEVK